jgi:hypothetical protein
MMIQIDPSKPSAAVQAAVIAFTEEMFANRATIEVKPDPEIEGLEPYVVQVAVSGDVASIVKLDHDWHLRLLDVAGPDAHHFCLSLEVT